MECRLNSTRVRRDISSNGDVNPTRRLLFVVVATAIVVGLVGVGSTVIDTGGSDHLVVTHENGTELLSTPVANSSQFELEYTHSVERTLVTDAYQVQDGKIVSDWMAFSSFGAGLPAEATVERVDGRYIYQPPAHSYDTLTVSTGHIAGHELRVGGETYDLVALAAGETVRLTIDSR